MPIPRILFAAVIAWCACANAFADGAAESSGKYDADTQAALASLRPLTPQEQDAAIAEMRRSLRAGELGARQVPLLAGLIEDSPWTAEHRRQVAYLLAALGEKAKPTLERLSS